MIKIYNKKTGKEVDITKASHLRDSEKRIVIETEVYPLSMLSKEAQEKAHKEFIKGNDYPFLEDYLLELLNSELKENQITNINDINLYYSLSYCQGDGLMFRGSFSWKDYVVTIKHSGHYNHSNSKTISIEKDYDTPCSDKEYEEFESIYQDICKKLEKAGYDYIENEDSFESFRDNCEDNSYTFTKEGIMKNY